MTDTTPLPVWQAKSVDETMELYAEWADNYDSDVSNWGYATPSRIASALKRHLPDTGARIHDFGCGTGLSGFELAREGYTNVDGSDISEEMLAKAQARGVYKNLIKGEPGKISASPGDYDAITAMGVISIGAAPADTLRVVLDALAPGGFLAFSYNDATLPVTTYVDELKSVQNEGIAELIFDEYGPHLPGKGMKSRVYILEKK